MYMEYRFHKIITSSITLTHKHEINLNINYDINYDYSVAEY